MPRLRSSPQSALAFVENPPGHIRCFCCGFCGPPSGHVGYFCYGGRELRPGHVGDCSGRERHPRCIGAGRSTSVRTAPARPAQPAAVRCVRTLFAHMLKRPSPPAPAPKELVVLPPWPAAASTDRHRQKYSLCFKVPSAVQTRPAVPLGSHSCLPFPHSLRLFVPVSHLFAPVLKRRSPSARGQQVLSLPMAGGLAAVCFGLYHCGCSGSFDRPFTGFCFPQSRAAAVKNSARAALPTLPGRLLQPRKGAAKCGSGILLPSIQGAAHRGCGSPWQVSQSF